MGGHAYRETKKGKQMKKIMFNEKFLLTKAVMGGTNKIIRI